jgi:hypothetical protein
VSDKIFSGGTCSATKSGVNLVSNKICSSVNLLSDKILSSVILVSDKIFLVLDWSATRSSLEGTCSANKLFSGVNLVATRSSRFGTDE